MHTFTHMRTGRYIVTFFLIGLLVALPLTPRFEKQTANAQYSVVVVGGSGTVQDTISAVKNTITAAEAIFQSGLLADQWFKEYVLDPIVWQLANTVITNMLTELTRWVNSGFQGDPAFVTDLEGFLLNTVDEAAGEFIYGTELGFLCEPFELDVRLALAIQYETSVRDYQPQCTLSQISDNIDGFLSGTFSEGGWQSWFELTQGRYNDANRAYIESQNRLLNELDQARNDELTELAANDFFLNVEVCGTTITVNGDGETCETSTLGNIVQEQFNHMLGLPGDRLAFADEFDELVGALLSQIVNQAITGVNGLLGLGGNSRYSNNSFGSSGNSSYLQAVQQEASSQQGSGGGTTNVIPEAIATQQAYIALQNQIIASVDNLEDDIQEGEDDFPGCFDVSLPSNLTTARTNAQNEIIATQSAIQQLTTLNTQYQGATTAEARLGIMQEFRNLQLNGTVKQDIALTETELYIEFELTPQIEASESNIEDEREECD